MKIQYEEKQGNNHVFEMSDGIIEIYKICVLRYLIHATRILDEEVATISVK